MLKSWMRFAVFSVMVFALGWQVGQVWGKTWHLEEGRFWRDVSRERQDKYLLVIARIKQLVNEGKAEAVGSAVAELKKEFPELAGPDLDAFMEAEMLFYEGSYVKAVRSYDRFLAEFPESQFYEAALEREFAIATAFLAGKKKRVLRVFKIRGYAEGIRIMERITDRAGDAPIGIKAAVAVAKNYEQRGKFEQAYQQWSMISSRWPTGQFGKEALLGMARCKHAAYRGPKYDASDLISARTYYENFRLRYPEDANQMGIERIIERINEQLAYKQLSIGRYYERAGNRQAANFYYQMVADNWPESTAAKMVKQSQK